METNRETTKPSDVLGIAAVFGPWMFRRVAGKWAGSTGAGGSG